MLGRYRATQGPMPFFITRCMHISRTRYGGTYYLAACVALQYDLRGRPDGRRFLSVRVHPISCKEMSHSKRYLLVSGLQNLRKMHHLVGYVLSYRKACTRGGRGLWIPTS